MTTIPTPTRHPLPALVLAAGVSLFMPSLSTASAANASQAPQAATGNCAKSAPSAEAPFDNHAQVIVFNSLTDAFSFQAERVGFEPTVGLVPYAALAMRYLRPLGHLSGISCRRPWAGAL